MPSAIMWALAASMALLNLVSAAITPEMSLDSRQVLKRQSLSGQATEYGGNVQGGECSFSTYTLPAGLYGTALSDSNWNSAGNCGGCVAVTGPKGNTITAMIVDQCPGCGQNHLDLFTNAFEALSPLSAGVINVNWNYVPCPDVSGNLQIHMKSGVSEYYFAAQVVNAKRRTSTLEYSVDQGKTWKPTVRQEYNFFLIGNSAGAGASSVWIRVTSHVGTKVVVKNVAQTADVIATATANYA